jgi:hypothetical protein
VAEQLHQGREADTQPQHLRGKGMPQPVRCDMSETTGTLRGLGYHRAKSFVQGLAAPTW